MSELEENFSEDGETFYPGWCEMLERLESAGELEVGREYEKCFATPVTSDDLRVKSIAGYVMENIDERLGDLRCLPEDEYPCDDLGEEAKDELATLLGRWIEKHVLAEGRYKRLLTAGIEKKAITEQDIIDFHGSDAE